MIALPYITLVLILFLRHYASNAILVYKSSEKFFIYFILSVFFCFRGYIFTDVFNYLPFFDHCPNIIEIIKSNYLQNAWWEPGFVLYCGFFKLFTDNWIVFQVFDSIINLMLLYKGLEFFKSNRALNIAVFLAMMGLISFIDTIRNIKAILIFFISLRYMTSKKALKYYLCCFAAVSFHRSAVFYFFAYPFLNAKINKKIFLLYGLLSCFFAVISRPLVLFCIEIVDSYLPKGFQNLISIYIESQNSMSLARVVTLGTLEKIIVFILVYIKFDNLKKNQNDLIMVKAFLLYFSTYFLFFGFGEISKRISTLFIFSCWCLIPRIIKEEQKRYQYLYIYCVLVYCLLRIALYNQPVQEYENFLFNASSFEERKRLMEISF